MLLKKNNYNDKIINYRDVFKYLFKLYKFNKLYKLNVWMTEYWLFRLVIPHFLIIYYKIIFILLFKSVKQSNHKLIILFLSHLASINLVSIFL